MNRSQPEVVSLVFAGLGGQGVLKASDIAAETAFRCGLDVKKAEVHGMSQRGGFVTSDVRYGRQVWSPMVSPGEADFLIVLEDSQLEASRWYLRPGGMLLTRSSLEGLRLPSPKSLNIALLGMLSARLDLPLEAWIEAIRSNLPEKFHEPNLGAFHAARALMEGRKE